MWVLALTLMGIMIFGTYRNYEDLGKEQLSKVENILFESTNKIIWGLCLAFIIYSCITRGGNSYDILLIQIKNLLSI